MSRAPTLGSAGGFTLLEMAVAIVLLALVLGNVFTIVTGTTKDLDERNAVHEADVQARRALDRIALAIVGSYEGSLFAQPHSPDSEDRLNYEEFLGMGDTNGDGVSEAIFSAPMRIALSSMPAGEVAWSENPEMEGEKRVVWVKDVPRFSLGEVSANGVDDNDNGLIDESGLAFVKDGKSVRILLSLRRSDGEGGWIERMVETTVTCRN